MATFGTILKQLRQQYKITQGDLATKLGISRSTVGMYETDNRKPDYETLEAIADLFNVDMNYLLGKPGSENRDFYSAHNILPLPPTVPVPRVGQIACGQPILAEEHITAYDQLPAKWRADFTLICKGDSMEPHVHDGDIVAIRKQPEVENGQIAAVLIGEEATLKVVRRHPQFLELRPLNPQYDSIFVYPDNPDGISIEGLAVGFWHELI